jgi:hypothetical protein
MCTTGFYNNGVGGSLRRATSDRNGVQRMERDVAGEVQAEIEVLGTTTEY